MKKRLIITLFLILIFTLSLALVYVLGIYNKIRVKENQISNNTQTPTPTPDPMGTRNILLLGYGGVGHEGANLTDTIILAHIIPKENQVFLISIPRDIWVPIQMQDGLKNFKINHAFAIGLDNTLYPNKLPEYKGLVGGASLAKNLVTEITNLKVDNFISINFEGFKKIINILGGIEVNVPYSFKDEYYPIKGLENDPCDKTEEEIKALTATMSSYLLEHEFKCRYETIEFKKGGPQVLDAETALKFVRSRHSNENGGDFQRALRQQALISGIKDKLIRINSIPKLVSLINVLADNVQTDIDIKTALNLLAKQEDINDIKIKSLVLTTDNVLREGVSQDGQYILLPKNAEGDWSQVHKFIQENLTP